MSRALAVVARLRKLAVDQARRELAARLSVEAAATSAEAAAQAALHNEHVAARALPTEEERGAFAAWLPRGLLAIAQTQEARVQAEGAADGARIALAGARAADEAVQQMLAREAAMLAAAAARREQAVLDELGRQGIGRDVPGVPRHPA
jgi:flagellar protein FliJ